MKLIDPPMDYPCSNIKSFTKLLHARRNSENGEYAVSSLVSRLLLGCLPSAIFGTIISVIVFASNAHAGWRISHVSEEVSEVAPASNHCDSATSIDRELFASGVEAPVIHCQPHAVNLRWSLVGSATLPVLKQASGGVGSFEAFKSLFDGRYFSRHSIDQTNVYVLRGGSGDNLSRRNFLMC